MDPVSAGGLVAVIGSMATTTRTVIEIVKATKAKAKNPEVENGLSEALEQIFTLQSGMIDLQAKILTLQEENSRLRNQIREEEKRADDRGQYQRKQIRNSVVMVREDEPNVYYCPACFESNKKIPLQRTPPVFQMVGSHKCPQCHAHFQL